MASTMQLVFCAPAGPSPPARIRAATFPERRPDTELGEIAKRTRNVYIYVIVMSNYNMKSIKRFESALSIKESEVP